MKHLFSLFPQFLSGSSEEHRLARFANGEAPKPTDTEPANEMDKKKPGEKPKTPETTPEEAKNPDKAAGDKKKAKVTETDTRLKAEANRLPKGVKSQPASAEAAQEAVQDAEKKAPETVRDDLSQKMDKAMDNYKKASEADPPDKNAQFKAILEVIAIVIEYIVRAFNGTLGDKLGKEKGAKDETEAPKGAEGAKAPAEGTPQAAAAQEVKDKVGDKPVKPEQTQKAAQEVQADATKQKETNEGSMKERQKSVDEKEKENKGLGEQKDSMEKKVKELDAQDAKDPKVQEEKDRLKTEIENIKSKIEANTKTIDAHKEKIAKLTEENKNLDAKKEAAKQIEQNMEPLKKWIPALEAMITATLGLKLGSGGIAIAPDGGKFAVDLLSPEDQAAAMKTLKGAEKAGERGVTITHENAAQAIADQLKGGGGAKASDAKPETPAAKPAAEKAPDKPAAKPAEKPADKPVEKAAVKPAEKLADKPAEKDASAPKEGEESPELRLKELAGQLEKAFKEGVVADNDNPLESEEVQKILGQMNQLDLVNPAEEAAAVTGMKFEIPGREELGAWELTHNANKGFDLAKTENEPAKDDKEAKETAELEKTVQELNKLMDEAFNSNEKAKNASPLTRLASQIDFKVQDVDGKKGIILVADQATEKDLQLIAQRIGYKLEKNGNLTRGEDRTIEKMKDGGYKLGLKEAFGTDSIDEIKKRLEEWKSFMEDSKKTQETHGDGTAAATEFDDKHGVDTVEQASFEAEPFKELTDLQKSIPKEMENTNLGSAIANVEWGKSGDQPAIRIKQEGAASFRKIYDQLQLAANIPGGSSVEKDSTGYVIKFSKESEATVKPALIDNLKWMETRFAEEGEKKPVDATKEKPAAEKPAARPDATPQAPSENAKSPSTIAREQVKEHFKKMPAGVKTINPVVLGDGETSITSGLELSDGKSVRVETKHEDSDKVSLVNKHIEQITAAIPKQADKQAPKKPKES